MRHQVVLRSTRDEDGTRELLAYINKDGCLVIDGLDKGPAVKAFFGQNEYEWTRTVSPEDFGLVAKQLKLPEDATPEEILQRIKRDYSGENARHAERMLEASGAKVKCWFWITD